MDKEELIRFIKSLPDDLQSMPIEITEHSQVHSPWYSTHESGLFGGIHKKRVENNVTIQLVFTTEYQGEFRREYTNPEGSFFNVKRTN